MGLAQVRAALGDKRLPDRAVAVTFDDGYADNVECGKPLLEQHGIPATVFVTTSYVGQEREFWWDDVERLLLMPGRLPETLRLQIGSTVHEWRLGDAAVYSEEEHQRNCAWNVEVAHDPSPRHTVYRALCGLLRVRSGDQRTAILDELSRIVGLPSTARPTHRPVSYERLARLAEDGAVHVGAHSATHAPLSALHVTAQRAEIAGSKARLEDIIGRSVTSFAYPFGGRADYTSTTVRLVREAGFALACSNIRGVVHSRSDEFQLPRMLVRNWDADTFASRLTEWLGD